MSTTRPSARDASPNAGILAGLITFLVVLLPAASCAWSASSSIARTGDVASPGRADLGGAALWTVATLVLLALPPIAAAVVDRFVARHAPVAVMR